MAEIKQQALDSREVAEMVQKEHKFLMRDIRRYINQIIEGNGKYFTECKIAPSDFFKESEYKDSTGRTLPCYRITKKGCEFIAHKLTGVKGTVFTARYINRFHEMEEIIKKQPVEQELPWFIHRFRGDYIMLFRDFKSLTGVELSGNYTAWKRPDRLQGGLDYNGWGWYTKVNMEEFKKEYGFDYGPDKCMDYLYPCGIKKALEIYRRENGRKINQEAYDKIVDGLKAIEPPKKEIEIKQRKEIESTKQNPIQITLIINQNGIETKEIF